MSTPPTPQALQILQALRARTRHTPPEATHIQSLLQTLEETTPLRKSISRQAKSLATQVRNAPAGVMQQFLNEYDFSSQEGTALMCLAEAYLRTPDTPSLDTLIKDKVTGKTWRKNKGQNNSLLLNASHWSLIFTGHILKNPEDSRGIVTTMQKLVRKLGEPVVRVAIAKAMKLMGGQFVLGETMPKAIARAQPTRKQGYRFSYDMLGEAARCEKDAQLYLKAYHNAIRCLKPLASPTTSPHNNCGISVKLTAIHPRYELGQKNRVRSELVPRLISLVKAAYDANIPLTLDAEEADRSDLLLEVLEATLVELDKLEQKKSSPKRAGRKQNDKKWDGFGIVVQAYRTNAYATLDFIFELAQQAHRKIAVRLVKGAYWDAEIKHAQTLGVEHYPVFTRKCSTDLSYLACARKLMSMRNNIFPQFGTHNAHTATAILAFAQEHFDANDARCENRLENSFELQRIHGMGEALHENLRTQIRHNNKNNTLPAITTRIYAPVGIHQDLLAYLVRRMLENGANSSFVHQVLDRRIPISNLVEDPVTLVELHRQAQSNDKSLPHPKIVLPPALFAPRKNARGWNLNDIHTQQAFLHNISKFKNKTYEVRSHLGNTSTKNTLRQRPPRPCKSPADGHALGSVIEASDDEIARTCENLRAAHKAWAATSPAERAKILETFADLLEQNAYEAIALLSREAGKTLWDGISEVREAVDFARFYAMHSSCEAREKLARKHRTQDYPQRLPRGLVVCIAPWNFPLAIFCGQISAALACGNSVLAKPAEQTPLIADLAIKLFYRAGVPRAALACLFGTGERVGKNAIQAAKPDAVCFTGSQATARLIDRQLAELGKAILIAETGGINAMIVDSTALVEQVVRDVLVSAFQSSGQRCSALRLLFVQKDLEKTLLPMLAGATSELKLSLPWQVESDMGPLIDADAQKNVQQWCRALSARDSRASLLFRGNIPKDADATRQGYCMGYWMPPHIFRIEDTQILTREIFGPILHVQTYTNKERDQLLPRINAMGYGLTFGIHSRIDSRIAKAVSEARCGNIYVNRNQIGAVVGCQPFGGEEMSGTGPKAGGADLLLRLSRTPQSESAFAKGGLRGGIGASSHTPLYKRLTEWRSLLAPAIGIFDSRANASASSSSRKDWTEAPERLARLERVVRAWKPASSRACAQSLLAQARAVYANDGILPGTTGERNRLYTTERGIVACCGERDKLSLQVLVALAFGNRVVCAKGENSLDTHDAYLDSLATLAPQGHFWQLVAQDFFAEGLRHCHVALFDGKDEEQRRKLRTRLAAFPDRRRLLLSLDDEVNLLAAQRVVSEDTTASGGNASLLLAASKG